MRDSTTVQLSALAPNLLLGEYPDPCPISAQRAIAILEILQDGEWHTTKAIAARLGIKRKYVADILRACKEAWGLASSRGNGWMLLKKGSVIIV
jgi:DNA-binding IscR family transcriptional regulator